MPKKRFSSAQIIAKLRQIEVQLAQGKSIALACKEAAISEQSYYRWRKEYGGLQIEQTKRLKDLERENARLRRLVADLSLEKQILKDISQGNLVQPRVAPAGRDPHPREVWPLGAPRLPPRQPARRDPALCAPLRADEDALTQAIVALASQYGRYGYRRITALLQRIGWRVGPDRVQRIWRREGLKVPKKHKPRARLWLNGGSCLRLRPERANHVWSFDFVESHTHDGRSLRVMTLIDKYTREYLALKVARRITSFGVIETLADAMLAKGIPEHVRCDNGSEMVARALREWLAQLGTKTLYIEPDSPWENGYFESFNGKLRDECLKLEIFYSLKEAQVVIGAWRDHYNRVRPHSSLGYRAPAPITMEAPTQQLPPSAIMQ